VRNHITPSLGRIKLHKLRPDHIQRLYADSSDRGLQPATVKLINSVLRRGLNQAIEWGLLASAPTRSVRLPQVKRLQTTTWNPEQVKVFLSACEDHRLHALFYLALTTGLRQGELLGLLWSDLDWETGTLQIQRQLRRVRTEGLQLRELKTESSRRSIILGAQSVAQLRAHKRLQLEERLVYRRRWKSDSGLIFTNTKGKPVDPTDVVRIFHGLVAQTDLPQIRFHDLRHTAATLMLARGLHPKIVQERLGHSSISMTLDTYSHVVPSLQREAADKIEQLIS